MSDIDAAEELLTTGPRFDPRNSSPAKDRNSPRLETRTYDSDVAMKGVDAEEGSNLDSPRKSVSPATVLGQDISPDVKAVKKITEKITEEVYASDPRKVETMRDFDNSGHKKHLKV